MAVERVSRKTLTAYQTKYDRVKYIKSLRWFCDANGNTGAHYWRLVEGKRVWQCCFCHRYRAFPLNINECVMFETIDKLMQIYENGDLPVLLHQLSLLKVPLDVEISLDGKAFGTSAINSTRKPHYMKSKKLPGAE